MQTHASPLDHLLLMLLTRTKKIHNNLSLADGELNGEWRKSINRFTLYRTLGHQLGTTKKQLFAITTTWRLFTLCAPKPVLFICAHSVVVEVVVVVASLLMVMPAHLVGSLMSKILFLLSLLR